MTIPNTARKAGPLLGNGSQTAWPFTFKVFAAGDVQVTIANSAGVETVLVLGTDYSVSLNANQETSPGGIVTYPLSGSALPAGSVLAIIGDLDYDQPLDLPSGGNFSPTALENQLDRSTMQIQQLREEMNRTAKLPPTSSESVEALVDDLQRIADSADNVDTVATNIANVNTVASDLNEPVSEINTVATNIANVNTVGANITNVNTVAGISANVTTVAGISANVTTVAGISANVTAVAGNAANITAVASNATNINAVNANKTNIDAAVGNATNINAVAGNATNINAVNANKTNIDTVAGVAANVTTVAGISSDVTTVAGISADVAAVENIAANVTTVAGIAPNVTTVAGISANVTTVAGVSSDVTTVATNIASVNSAASNMAAIIAAPSEAAAAAASAAAAAASAASGMYSNVQDKSTNYTVATGDAGDLIRVSTSGGAVTITLPAIATQVDGFKVAIAKWSGDANAVTIQRASTDLINGSATYVLDAQYKSATFVADAETNTWFAAGTGGGGTNIIVDSFDGTGAQTAFTLSGDPGTENNTQVFVGGVYQEKDQYTVSGTTLTFSSAPPAGTSNIEVVWSIPLSIGTPSDGTVSTAKLADDAVTFAKVQNIATARLLGRSTAGTGDVEELTASTARTLLSLVVGTDVQAYDADLADLATNGPGTGNNQYVKRDASAKTPLGSTWKVYESAGVLYFEVSGVAKAKLDGSGNLTVVGNVTAYGTV